MSTDRPQTLDQLVVYLGGHPATSHLADEIDQVMCHRRNRSATPDGPARPRTAALAEGRGR